MVFLEKILCIYFCKCVTSNNIDAPDQKSNASITDDEIVAECFLFFAAGYDTSATTLSYAAYELARQPDIQEKIRQEIKKVLEKYNNKMTYDGLGELVYAEKVIYETLRKYPLVPTISRVCTKAYKVPGSDLTIDKGTVVKISAMGLHMDAEYYRNPEVFNPDRFDGDGDIKKPDFTFLPFGEGPRICIALIVLQRTQNFQFIKT
ncbi:cytochrome P450 6k1-like isoform X2 [Sitophilus oryzae]|uniref:Cytochrome P450 6k1-like isoform X2 n=1 Tax=Sitophilus oryzae TaxID=7048 RepID=A0A6J2YP25_SITOR|nr:cytochrome P450 6k1-like isoform X2 [Sitophilus oryzae]